MMRTSGDDARFQEIMTALVKHLHAFIKEVKLTEKEFQLGVEQIIKMGQQCNDAHNEVVLMAGSLGVSQLVCLMNNTDDVDGDTTANLLGPFWRDHTPPAENGSSIVRSETPGETMFVKGTVTDEDGKPVPDARVDIWHSATNGLYEQQDSKQVEMNLRGMFKTDDKGQFWFRSIKPSGYPIPTEGVAGQLLKRQHRQHFRPAHLHVLINKPGFKTQVTQVYVSDDPLLDKDPQFGVTERLVGDYIRHGEKSPEPDTTTPWWSLDYTFVLRPGDSALPRPPIK
ncbi:MAG: catechol 1,2-dioxygenase [Hyphomicrobiales bacterium]|nr:catechol 1,2-dioxygenase [Hyphomicrobiales bacterium]